MIERINQKRQNQEGFTLVELLVVIVILGILAAIVVFAVGGITDKGTSSAQKTDVAVLQSAEEAVFAQTGYYVSQTNLKDNAYIRSISSNATVCLKDTIDTTTKTPSIGGVTQTFTKSSSNYEVKSPATAACSSGYTAAN